MKCSGAPWARLNILLASLLLLIGFASPAAVAQDEVAPAAIDFLVAAYTCGSDPGDVSVAAGNIPAYCSPTAGVWLTVATFDGAFSGGCATDGTGMCSVSVPDGTTVTVTQDVATAPAGTFARENPLTVQVVDGNASATFLNIALAQPTEAPVPTEAPLPTEAPPPTEVPVPTDAPMPTATLAPTPTPTPSPEPTVTPTIPPTPPPTPTATLPPTPAPTLTPTPSPSPTPTATPARTPAPTATATSASVDTSRLITASTPTPTKAPTPTPTPTPTPAPKPTSYATVSNTGGLGLRCRTAPNTSAPIITVLREGTRVEARGAASNGWLPVRCGQDGWVYTDYVTVSTTTTPAPSPGGSTSSATVSGTGGAGLNCRVAPVSGAVITVLREGARAESRGAASNGWLPVRCGGQDGWVSMTYITVSTSTPGSNPTPTPPPASGPTGSATVTNTGGMGLRCRTSPSTSAPVISVLGEGTRVESRGSASNGWLPVRCGGQDGWMHTDYLTLSSSGSPTPSTPPKPSGTARSATVSGTGGAGLRCRTVPVSGGIITILPEGAWVDGRGDVSNGWFPVRCGGRDGWVSATYLTFHSGSSGGGELWIDINLSTQYMIVYRGGEILGQTYVSTGRAGFDTPPGTFYVNYKLPSQTMSGVLGGEYYYVPEVPDVMYFTDRGHAIHGAYWHNNFGSVMSHGCVNLPVGFASWLYDITPVGTRVYIHY